jgi:hypothetical protein
LSRFCDNGTVIFRLAKTIDYNETSRTIRVTARSRLTDSDQQAVLYIVVVLLFYSCGIIIGIVTYLKREKDEMEEERAYEEYMNFKADPARMARHFCKQQYTTRLREMEEAQKLREETKKAIVAKDKQRLSKKRHSHGTFHFLSGSKNTSPVTSPTRPPKPQIIIDNFDELVERGEIIREEGRESPGSGNCLLPQIRVNIDHPVLEVQQNDLRAMGLASSMPSLIHTGSRKSNLIVTEL